MKVYLISYSTANYRLSHLLLNLSGRIFGAGKCITYTEKWFKKTDFYTSNKKILDNKKGAGFWLWKYYCINNALSRVSDNDIVLYCDAGTIIKKRIKSLINILIKNDGILLFNQNTQNKYWIKRDCYISLNCDSEVFYNAPQIVGNVQVFQKNEKSLQFVESVLSFSVKDNLITDFPNILGFPDIPSFIEHRNDQAVTSLIAHKNKLTLYPDPTQCRCHNFIYKHPDIITPDYTPYKTIVYIHRYNNRNLFKLPFLLITELIKSSFKKY